METFRALFVEKEEERCMTRVRTITEDDLPPGEVTIRVAYSGVNYKDGLAVRADGKVVTAYPFIPGIDLSGTVEQSADGRFRPGDRVLVTGYGLGVSHFGGYSEVARVPGDWVVPLPDGLSQREAMI
ncbi:MAG: quinone oxidoreductase, YhdH/YhfP family, partial [Paenibacillus sp.]|nr:quinone oxidoreductase, YhdH/YhfP family [Paenibacillus sp.]